VGHSFVLGAQQLHPYTNKCTTTTTTTKLGEGGSSRDCWVLHSTITVFFFKKCLEKFCSLDPQAKKITNCHKVKPTQMHKI
jgi:hypothetical protein